MELIKLYWYYEDQMMENVGNEKYTMFKKLRDYVGSLIEGGFEYGR